MSIKKENDYVAFKCMDCDCISVYPNKEADGNKCLECGGYIAPFGYAKVKGKHINDITVGVSVDTTEIDEATKKVERLAELLNKTKDIELQYKTFCEANGLDNILIGMDLAKDNDITGYSPPKNNANK